MISEIFLEKRSLNSLNLSYDVVVLMFCCFAQNAKEIKFCETCLIEENLKQNEKR